jgi:toxin ParE1/3/4
MPPPRISLAAQQDIDEIYLYGILTYGPAQADGYINGLRIAVLLIAQHPQMGRERDEVRPPIRLWVHEAHHVFYDLIDGTVVVQRVLHYSADWIELF